MLFEGAQHYSSFALIHSFILSWRRFFRETSSAKGGRRWHAFKKKIREKQKLKLWNLCPLGKSLHFPRQKAMNVQFNLDPESVKTAIHFQVAHWCICFVGLCPSHVAHWAGAQPVVFTSHQTVKTGNNEWKIVNMFTSQGLIELLSWSRPVSCHSVFSLKVHLLSQNKPRVKPAHSHQTELYCSETCLK